MISALAVEKTIPAYPLGKPVDGRARYGMTPEQARMYRWLVNNRPHHEWFAPDFRKVAAAIDCGLQRTFDHFAALVERGWLEGAGNNYRLVAPVMSFREAKV